MTAAPLAAGMIADAMATGQIQEEFGSHDMGAIISYARGWRRAGGESVIWNHVDRAHNPPSGVLRQSWLNQTSNATAVA